VSALPSLDEIKRYSATVCEQIRWKKAHSGIAQEIEDHLCDQRDYYLAEGVEEETATQKAILQMGDAVHVGTLLDKTHKPKPQWLLILLTFSLMLVGTGVRYFIDVSEASLVKFSMVPFIIAMAIFLAAYFLDFTALGKYPKICYFLVLLLSMAGITVGPEVNGRAWFFFAGFGMNLSYLALIFPLIYSLFIYAMRSKGTRGILLCGAAYIPYAFILLLVPSTTGFVLYTFSSLILLLTAMRKGWFGGGKRQGLLMVLVPSAVSVISVIFLFLLQPYRFERLKILLDPASDPRGYQTVMIRELMSGAVFAGRGIIPQQYGGDVLSLSWFDTDLVLTALTHKYGWIVFIGIAFLFIAFSALGFKYVSRQRSVLGLMVSLPILLVFVTQVILYMATNLGYGLLTALSLPLVSYGKAALFLNAGLIGVMLSVFRTGEVIRDGCQPNVKDSSFISYEDGKLIINLKG
jgi:cell division protein FtsW (lipid II flippase)